MMISKESMLAEEMQKTLYQLSRNDNKWKKVNGVYGCESTINEVSEVIKEAVIEYSEEKGVIEHEQ